jgi:glycosidase
MQSNIQESPKRQDSWQKIQSLLLYLYGERAAALTPRLRMLIGRYGVGCAPALRPGALWSEKDVVLITYADMVRAEKVTSLSALRTFLLKRLKGVFPTVHLLPFYPWSSDDGFSVIDYRKVAADYGTWEDIQRLRQEHRLMYDLVLNHCSAKSEWFRDFVTGIAPARDYFVTADPGTDLSQVVRPRPWPLLTRTPTSRGDKWVWTTFSEDQVDLDWSNPDVLFEFLDILMLYVSKGMQMIRLDAVAFLWKELGTTCVHLPQTHAMVQLIRAFLEMIAPQVLIITETNVPHRENISYFGAGDEAHMVYNFSLPPLLLHGLLRGSCRWLRDWAKALQDPPAGCTWFNFSASHDGIGVRPIQDLVEPSELDWLVEWVYEKGGRVNTRTNSDGTQSPYELNITYFSALSNPADDSHDIQRFLCSQAVILSLQGIPGVYFNSLIGAPNDQDGVQRTQHNRAINRQKWRASGLETDLEDPTSRTSQVFTRMVRMIKRRTAIPAFHPDSPQEILDLGDTVFALRRGALGKQAVYCIFNFSSRKVTLKAFRSKVALPPEVALEDALGMKSLLPDQSELSLQPYQYLWLVAS